GAAGAGLEVGLREDVAGGRGRGGAGGRGTWAPAGGRFFDRTADGLGRDVRRVRLEEGEGVWLREGGFGLRLQGTFVVHLARLGLPRVCQGDSGIAVAGIPRAGLLELEGLACQGRRRWRRPYVRRAAGSPSPH